MSAIKIQLELAVVHAMTSTCSAGTQPHAGSVPGISGASKKTNPPERAGSGWKAGNSLW